MTATPSDNPSWLHETDSVTVAENGAKTPSSNSTTPEDEDSLVSPNAMAEAALAAGVADRKRRDCELSDSDINLGCMTEDTTVIAIDNPANKYPCERGNKRQKVGVMEAAKNKSTTYDNSEDSASQLVQIWKFITYDDEKEIEESMNHTKEMSFREKAENALDRTKKVMYREIDGIIRAGLNAFHRCDSLSRELLQEKEACETRGREVQRLQASEAESRASVSNLLRAIESSKSGERDSSRAVQIEARLRSEISTLRAQLDEALGSAAEEKRKSTLMGEEVHLLKSKLNRLSQDKMKMERDSRAALSLARSMDNHASRDVDFYKRKVADLNDHLQSKNALIAQQKNQLEEYKRQMERSISQNKLAKIRSETSDIRGSR